METCLGRKFVIGPVQFHTRQVLLTSLRRSVRGGFRYTNERIGTVDGHGIDLIVDFRQVSSRMICAWDRST